MGKQRIFECQTIKPGKPCIHWHKEKGCTATEYGRCLTVVKECKGCDKIDEQGYCVAYAFPRKKWRTRPRWNDVDGKAMCCPLKPKDEEKNEKKFVNPLKESKRGGNER
jgi:hypothetical protein